MRNHKDDTIKQATNDQERRKNNYNSKIKYELEILKQQEAQFRNRDNEMASHLKRIQDRDDAIFSHFTKPTMITQAKLEEARTARINKLSDNLG